MDDQERRKFLVLGAVVVFIALGWFVISALHVALPFTAVFDRSQRLAQHKFVHAEKRVPVGPDLFRLPARVTREMVELVDGIFVGILGVNALAFREMERATHHADVLRDADAGMYAAKQRGRNQLGFVTLVLQDVRVPQDVTA